MTPPLEVALARHRAVSIGALAVLTLLAWAWLLASAGTGTSLTFPVPDPGSGGRLSAMVAMPRMGASTAPLWSMGRIAVTFAMWWVMMVAMMLPSAAPTILLYSRIANESAKAGASTGSFLAGYLVAWGGFSALAMMLQALFERNGLITVEMITSQSRALSGIILTAAGAYQLSPLKSTCLRHCRSPAQFLGRHYHPGSLGALRMGAQHGSICIGCCWMLMVLLFVGGVMNLVWIALITALVAGEKLLPRGPTISVFLGVGCLIWGVWTLLI